MIFFPKCNPKKRYKKKVSDSFSTFKWSIFLFRPETTLTTAKHPI